MKFSSLVPKSNYYRIKVIPKQGKTEARGVMADGTIKIALTAAPEKGKANKELVAFIAKELGISRDQVTITAGLISRIKVIDINLD